MTARNSLLFWRRTLGGTKLAAAIADTRGGIVAELTEPTDRRGAALRGRNRSPPGADKLAQTVGIEVTRARHVMVGIPGAIDPRTGRVFPDSKHRRVGRTSMSSGFLRGPASDRMLGIENDVNLAMLGGACARVCQSLPQRGVSLALGTGAGLGLPHR